jgi:hypothetical protein
MSWEYTLTSSDDAACRADPDNGCGVSAIMLKLGMPGTSPFSTWMANAKRICDASGIRWDGPPNYSTSPISAGTTLTIPDDLKPAGSIIASAAGKGILSSPWTWVAIGAGAWLVFSKKKGA